MDFRKMLGQLYNEAINRGSLDARYNLASLLLAELIPVENFPTLVDLLFEASKHGHPDSILMLAQYYYNIANENSMTNYEKSKYFYLEYLKINPNSPKAYAYIASAYKAVNNIKLAERYFEVGAALGDENAKTNLKRMREELSQPSIDPKLNDVMEIIKRSIKNNDEEKIINLLTQYPVLKGGRCIIRMCRAGISFRNSIFNHIR